ncbi:MAG: hypothetical protein WEB63_05985 [Cucumibacter sp.]
MSVPEESHRKFHNRPNSGPDRRIQFRWFVLTLAVLTFLTALMLSGWLRSEVSFAILIFLCFAYPAWIFSLIVAIVQRAWGRA